jgi:uncharacterized protein (TIGR02588 family)
MRPHGAGKAWVIWVRGRELLLFLLLGLLGSRVLSPRREAQNGQRGDGRDDRSDHTKETSDHERAVAEWTGFAISAAILLSVVGFLTYRHVTGEDTPPIVEVQTRIEAVRQAGERYYLPIEVVNRGAETAQDVWVRVELRTGSEEPEEAELQFDFLVGGASERGTAIFRRDPRQGELRVEVMSYLEP